MSKRTEIRKETVEHEVTVMECDICHEEIRIVEFPVVSGAFQDIAEAMGGVWWWRRPWDKLVGITRGSALDQKNSEFDVHVRCAYEVIKKATEK